MQETIRADRVRLGGIRGNRMRASTSGGCWRSAALSKPGLPALPRSPRGGVAGRDGGVLWALNWRKNERLKSGVALLAVGGYGRRELFPYSDVDLLFLLDGKLAEKDLKDAVRRVDRSFGTADTGGSGDAALRSAKVRRENTELRVAAGPSVGGRDVALYAKLAEQTVPKLMQRDQKLISSKLVQLTRDRHAKYGGTLFHLEPNIKECPGGLRDVHVCSWLATIHTAGQEAAVSQKKTNGTGG